MANENEKPEQNPVPQEQRQADALAALHHMQNTPPREEAPTADTNADSGCLSASGFVGMLAKGQLNEGDSVDLTPQPATNPPPAVPPTPKPVPVAEAEKDGSDTAEIREAKEIHAETPAVVTPRPVVRTIRRGVPAWYRMMTPVAFTVSSLLLLVGLWALLVSLHNLGLLPFAVPGTPVRPEDSDPDGWFYVPYVLVLSLPVGVLLGIMGVIMNRQIAAADRAAAGGPERARQT